MTTLPSTPATDRLDWLLAGLFGRPGWGADVAEVLGQTMVEAIGVERFRAVVADRARRLAPFTLIAVESDQHAAVARLRTRDGDVQVLHVAVEPTPPHRIARTWQTGLVPAGLTDRLPLIFGADEPDRPVATGQRIVAFAGLPGSGKSTLADATGRRLGVPVFAVDWLLGALTPFGLRHHDDLLGIGHELLCTLALRQLDLGQSAILDAPWEEPAARARLRSLADWAGATLTVVVCVCSDADVHRSRLQGRRRGIPGWHDGGDWANVARRRAAWPPWDGAALTVDAVVPLADNLTAVEACLADPTAPSE